MCEALKHMKSVLFSIFCYRKIGLSLINSKYILKVSDIEDGHVKIKVKDHQLWNTQMVFFIDNDKASSSTNAHWNNFQLFYDKFISLVVKL